MLLDFVDCATGRCAVSGRFSDSAVLYFKSIHNRRKCSQTEVDYNDFNKLFLMSLNLIFLKLWGMISAVR